MEHWWLMPVILASWEAEIQKIEVQGQPRKRVCNTPFPKLTRVNGLQVWLKQQKAYFASMKS
jgi:hypothetical protein